MNTVTFDTHAAVRELRAAGFTEQQAEALVRVIARAVGAPVTKTDLDTAVKDPPPGAFISQDFWTSPTLDDLAKAQNVGPLDADALFGTWPGDDDDGFEEAIDELRRSGLKKDVRS